MTTPQRLESWLDAHGLLDEPEGRVAVTADDLQAASDLRDGLRAWLLARQRLDYDASALHHGREVRARVRLHVDLSADGANLEPVGGDACGALGRLERVWRMGLRGFGGGRR